jgi:hypothetical protein
MKDIKDLLNRLPGFREPQKDKKIVAEAIKKHCGFEIDTKKIDFTNKTLRLNISHTEKSLIFMNQSKIIADLKIQIPDRGIEKIN